MNGANYGVREKKILNHSNLNRIVMEGCYYKKLVLSNDELFELLSSYILNSENLLFYCTQKLTCKTIKETRKYVKNA